MPVLLGSCCGIVRTDPKRARGHVSELIVNTNPVLAGQGDAVFTTWVGVLNAELCEGLEVSGRSIAKQRRASSYFLWVSFNLIYNTEGLTHALQKSVGLFHVDLIADQSVMSLDIFKARNCS